MKLNEVLYDDKERLLELAIFMSLNLYQLDEAAGDWRNKFKYGPDEDDEDIYIEE